MLLHSRNEQEILREFGFVIYQDLVEESLLDDVAAKTKESGNTLDLWLKTGRDATVELAFHPRILATLRNLYNAEPFPFQTLNFRNPPAIGLHSDVIHFSSEPVGWMCGVWIALEDISEDAGPLIYFPASHHQPIVGFEDIGLTPSTDNVKFHKNLGIYSKWLEQTVIDQEMQQEVLICPKGTVLVWHANLMHKSQLPATKGLSRLSQVTHYYFDRPNLKFTVPAFGKHYGKESVRALHDLWNS